MGDDDRAERRKQAEMRLQILDALVLATSRRTELWEAVGQADEVEDAERRVRDLLGVGEVPAKAVIDAQLRRFTSRERARLVSMRNELRRSIDGLAKAHRLVRTSTRVAA